jgi:hypothetical protein
MKNFIRNFLRDSRGRWTCAQPATLDTPAGRIQVAIGTTFTRGTKFMNCDLAAMLDCQQAKDDRQA